VLFSNDAIARFINQSFEPAWEMVRPVPVVRIDFGNGHVVTRTLHGNIASYVCRDSRHVLDILPGMYAPDPYLACLNQFQVLARNLAGAGPERLQEHHRNRAQALRSQPQPVVRGPGQPVAGERPFDRPKRVVEARLERVVAGNAPARPQRAINLPPAGLAQWELLAEDTRRNETTRRIQIHERLAASGLVRPDQIKNWLYREVLHADLDDPYLGLRNIVLGDDVFQEEAPAR
jgi:hypothetical protein